MLENYISIGHWGMFPTDTGRIQRVRDAISGEISKRTATVSSLTVAALAAYKPVRPCEPRHFRDEA